MPDYVPFHLSIELREPHQAAIIAPRAEIEILQTAMQAGTDMDIYISHVHADEAQKLQQSAQAVLQQHRPDRLEWVLSHSELLDVICILDALQVLGVDDHFPELSEAFPPEETLEEFGEHVHRIYSRLKERLSAS